MKVKCLSVKKICESDNPLFQAEFTQMPEKKTEPDNRPPALLNDAAAPKGLIVEFYKEGLIQAGKKYDLALTEEIKASEE